MPFKSIAQLKKFKELVKEGKISSETAMKWWSETNFDNLPNKINKNDK